MNEIKGYWVKYDEQPGKWCSDDASYNKLYEDLKGSKTGWDISESKDECEKHLCGEMIANDGTDSGDIYVYYRNEANDKRIPLMYIKVRKSCVNWNEKAAEIFGTEMILEDQNENRFYNFEVEPKLLPELIAKLRETDIREEQIKKYEDKLTSYTKLLELEKNGIKTGKDILFLYSNFKREDTILARNLMQNRNVQDDYDSLNFEEKCEFINIICELDSGVFCSKISPTSRLKMITGLNQEDKLFEISDKEVLIATATSTQLGCFDYANAELINNRDTLLEILENFTIHYSIGYIKKIPMQLRTDIEVIQALTRSDPTSIRDVLYLYLRDENSELKKKLKDKSYVHSLLNAYFNNVLSYEKNIKEQYVYCDLLWNFDSDTLEGIENIVLHGPEPTPERENFKNKIYSKTISKREEIIGYRKNK